MRNWIAIGMIASTLACTNEVITKTAPSALGIVELEIHETATELSIIGTGANHEAIAHLELRVGRYYNDEWEQLVDGRQLSIWVNGRDAMHESAGAHQLELPLFDDERAELNEFLLEPRVEAALARWKIGFGARWGVGSLDAESTGVERNETPYAISCGNSAENPAPSAACQGNGTGYSCLGTPDWTDEWDAEYETCTWQTRQFTCCAKTVNGGTQRAAYRTCDIWWGGQYGGCGAQGPNNCAVCWTVSYNNTCTTSHGDTTYAWCEGGVLPHFGIGISYD